MYTNWHDTLYAERNVHFLVLNTLRYLQVKKLLVNAEITKGKLIFSLKLRRQHDLLNLSSLLKP